MERVSTSGFGVNVNVCVRFVRFICAVRCSLGAIRTCILTVKMYVFRYKRFILAILWTIFFLANGEKEPAEPGLDGVEKDIEISTENAMVSNLLMFLVVFFYQFE